MELPGGTGYQTGQTNAERVVTISYGDDIQPAINGRYILVNRNSGKVAEVAGGSLNAGVNLRQNSYSGATYQQWNVTPVDERIGGDFSYFTLTAVHSGKAMDLLNWSLSEGGSIIAWDDTKGANQQWFLEYAEDGWFYIRNRHSAQCLDVYNAGTTNGMNLIQKNLTGNKSQQWRFLPVDAPVEFTPPSAPSALSATAQAASVRLDWTASPESDVAGYTVLRSDSAGGPYYTLARGVKANSFVDNTVDPQKTYYYTLRAVDRSLNRSPYAAEAVAAANGLPDRIARYTFEGNTLDSSAHLNHAAAFNSLTYALRPGTASQAVSLNGANAFIKLPATLFNHPSLTIATWIQWNGGANWQRIFDCYYDQNNYMYLTPKAFTKELRFGIKKDGVEQQLNTTSLTAGQWTHVAVSLGDSGACLYVNGSLAASSASVTFRPSDFSPC
jgi:hypothetical protein